MRSAAELHADDSKKFRYVILKTILRYSCWRHRIIIKNVHVVFTSKMLFSYSISGSCHVEYSYLLARALIVSDVSTCMIHDLCAGLRRWKVEGRITRISSKTLFFGMKDTKYYCWDYIYILANCFLGYDTVSSKVTYAIETTKVFIKFSRLLFFWKSFPPVFDNLNFSLKW